jgi:hypothetical protein
MKMKLALFLFLLPAAASAFSCGGTLTESCLGEKDIRYDKEASNALTDQAPVYSIHQGYYNCTAKFYDAMTGLPLVDGTSIGYPGLKVFPLYLFVNETYIGSRFYGHTINVLENVNQGGPGFAVPQEIWATSTYEKDGSQIQVGTNADFTDVFKPEGGSTTFAVDDRTIYNSARTVFNDNPLSVSQLYVCLDDECRQLSGNQDAFVDLGSTSLHFTQAVRKCDKIDSAEEWIQAVEEA